MNPSRVFAILLALFWSGVGVYFFTRSNSEEGISESDVAESVEDRTLPSERVGTEGPEAVSPEATSSAEKAVSFDRIFALSGSERAIELESYLQGLSPDNVSKFLEAAEALPPGRKRTAILGEVFARWGEVEQAAAFEYAKSMSGRSKLHFLSQAASGWAVVEPEAAWSAIMEASNFGSVGRMNTRSVLRAIAEDDLELAARLAMETDDRSPSSRNRLGPLIQVAEESGDYEGLLRLVDRYGSIEDRGRYLESVYEAWGQYDYEGPSAAILKLSDGKDAKLAMKGLLKGWANSDAAGAFGYALENQDDPAVALAIPEIVDTWITSVTVEELRQIPDQLAGLENYGEILNRSISRFARADPEMAFELASSLSEEGLREASIRSVMATWSHMDLDEATDFLAEIPDSKTRSSSAGMMVSAYLRNERPPEEIVRLVDLAETEQERERMLLNMLGMSRSPRMGEAGVELVAFLNEYVEGREDVSERFKERFRQSASQERRGSVLIRR